MHEDLAKKNGLKVGDKVASQVNLYDADNEKGPMRLSVTIKGHSQGRTKLANLRPRIV